MSKSSPLSTNRAKPALDETEVGSYFIANYPPFSFWTGAEVPAAEHALDSTAGPGVPLGLYLHVPFCRKRCKFCYFRVYTDKNSGEVQHYLDALVAEAELLGKRPALGRPLQFVYFGGGTPSFLSTAQLESLVSRLAETLSWDSAEEVTFECEPGTLNERKVRALKAMGVTRLSLGIENFDDGVLRENGRAHLSPEIYRAYEWIDDVGFPSVNIDLIAGMVGETDENWERSINEALALAPDSITIYQMELPFNTVYSREALEGGGRVEVAGWAKKREWVERAFERFEEAGYHVSSGYTLVRDPESCHFVYRDSLWRGADMVGIGVSSFSYVGGVHYQNLDKFAEYTQAIADGRLPISRALPIDGRECLIRELILQMKLGRLDAAYFRRKFDSDILQDFGDVFRELEEKGYLERENGGIHLTREGLLRVDSLLPRFFLPHHRDARYT